MKYTLAVDNYIIIFHFHLNLFFRHKFPLEVVHYTDYYNNSKDASIVRDVKLDGQRLYCHILIGNEKVKQILNEGGHNQSEKLHFTFIFRFHSNIFISYNPRLYR